MTRGLGSIPPIRGTLTQARDEAGNDTSAGRCTPTSGRTRHLAEGTGGRGKGEGSPSGRRRPGLAPGALGWPWHPRPLATARHRDQRGGLVRALRTQPTLPGPMTGALWPWSWCAPRITKIHGAVPDIGVDHEVAWPASTTCPDGCAGQTVLRRVEVTQVGCDGAMRRPDNRHRWP
jgi:hypothetical protein